MWRKFVGVCCFAWCACVFGAPLSNQSAYFLTLADIHFDPFIYCKRKPCPLIDKLQSTPVNNWPEILKAEGQVFSTYRQDSTYTLLQSALTAAKVVADEKQVKFIVVLGDFIGHDFRALFKKYSSNKSRAAYQHFIRQNLTFVNQSLAAAFPKTDIYSVLGNNDSFQDDYVINLQGSFFPEVANLWSQTIHESEASQPMRQQFSKAGYYAVNIPSQPNLRLIVLNSNLFSSNARGRGVTEAANAELNWLHQELVAAKKNKHIVFIAMHIPEGIDVYATLRLRLFRLIELWKPSFTKRFQSELKNFAPEIAGVFAGHLHTDYFQILNFGENIEIPVSGTPAISPIFGNNPGFKLYQYSPTTLQLENFVTYYYPLTEHKGWSVEYDFKRTYNLNCDDCPLTESMKQVHQQHSLINHYQYKLVLFNPSLKPRP